MGSCTQSARGEGPGESLEGTERDQKSFLVFSPSSLSVARWSCEKQTLKKSLPKSLNLLGLLNFLARIYRMSLQDGSFSCDVEAAFLSGKIPWSECTRRQVS